jgi:hypothetical protein
MIRHFCGTDGTDRKRLKKLRDEVGGQRSDFPISRFQISAFALASPRWSEDFTAKLFCNVEFWIERLAKLIQPQPEFVVDFRAGFLTLAP